MISFDSEDIDFELQNETATTSWLLSVAQNEKKNLSLVSYIFCSDKYLHKLNVEYLQHDTLTDVITFDYHEENIEGDIFISIDRVKENAADRNISEETELKRVMVHGLLHLIGYKDKKPEEQALMTEKEDFYLLQLSPQK